MHRIPLPGVQADGTPHWADIRDENDLTADDYLDFVTAGAGAVSSAGGGTVDGRAASQASIRTLLALGVAAWSLVATDGTVLPVPAADPTVTGRVPFAAAARLFGAVQPLMTAVSDRLEDPTDRDPMSPTVPSAG